MKYLVLNITNICNFSCKTCLRNTIDNVNNKNNIDMELLKRHLPDFKMIGYGNVALTGGEPVLHPQYTEILKYLYDTSTGFGIVCNGSLIEKYSWLIDYKKYLQYMCFSLDGANKETHDNVREEGSFDKLVNAIEWSVRNNIYTKVSMCINKLNKNEIEDVIKLCIKLKVNALNFLGTIGTEFNKEIFIEDNERREIFKETFWLMNSYKQINIFICSSLGTIDKERFCDSMISLKDLAINPKGEVVFCCDTIGNGVAIGSLYKEDVYSIFGKALRVSAYLRRLRREMSQKEFKPQGFDNCEYCNNALKNAFCQLELKKRLIGQY